MKNRGNFKPISIQLPIKSLLTDDDLDQLRDIRSAKKDFDSREDISIYISAEDLLKLRMLKDANLRLVIERPGCVESHNYNRIEYRADFTDSRGRTKTQLRARSESKDILREASRDISPKSSRDSSPGPYSRDRSSMPKKSPRKNTVIEKSGAEDISEMITHQKIINTVNTGPSVLADSTLNLPRYKREISVGGHKYIVGYGARDKKYSIFIIKLINDDIICRGVTDAQVYSKELLGMKNILIEVATETITINVNVYAAILTELNFPTYMHIVTMDFECDIHLFMMILPQILEAASAAASASV